jgi:hypothetical protein
VECGRHFKWVYFYKPELSMEATSCLKKANGQQNVLTLVSEREFLQNMASELLFFILFLFGVH